MFSYAFMRSALIVSLFISVLCPCIGMLLVVRRYSMIGDTLSHASLAGVSLALLTGGNPVLGAFVFTSMCGVLIEFLRTYFRKYTDLILSIVLSLSVGVAITLMSSGKLRASADSFLFGSVLTVGTADVVMAAALTAAAVLALVFLYDQLLYISWDEDAARVARVKVKLINYVFSVLVACAIAVSIRIVGVLVMSSMITLPVAAALQLEKGFGKTLVLSIVFSVTDIMLGLFVSFWLDVAPGGMTALVSVAVLVLVMLGKRIYRTTAAGR